MNLQFTPIFYPINTDNSAPMSEHEEKIFTGIWIAMNIIWIISLLGFMFRIIKNKRYDYYDDRLKYGELWLILDVPMLVIWVFIILCYLGIIISKFL